MITALTNTNSLEAQNTLTFLQNQNINNMQQLSTGQQINSAANNPAALAISQRLQEQSTGNSQAIKNIQEGLSMIQTADGGLSNIQSILQKMQTLAIEAQNTTLSSADVASIQKEMNGLNASLDAVSQNTKFNNISLLNNSSGLSFNGINGYVTVPDSSSLNSLTSKLSIEVKFTPTPNFGVLLAKMPSVSSVQTTAYGTGPFWLEMYPGGNVDFYLRINNNLPGNMVASGTILFNQPNDLVATYDATTGQAHIYLNGHLLTTGSGPTGFIPTSPGPFSFGTGNFMGSTNFKGNLSSVRLYNQILSPSEVTNNYQGQITQSGLVGDWLMNEGQGTTFSDNSGNGNLGTLNQATWANRTLSLQVGNKSSDTFSLSLPSISSNELGIANLQVNSPLALNFIQDALNVVVGQRESLGSQQVALQAQMANLQSSIVMTKSANSQIKDANMTQQMSELTKNQVQQQMSLSMLNTANQSPKILFKLLS